VTHDGTSRELKDGVRIITDLGEALRLWANHERGQPRRWRPRGVERSGPLYGKTAVAQAADYLRDVPGFDMAYPVLWWIWARGKGDRFHAPTFLQEYLRVLERDDVAARRYLGWTVGTGETERVLEAPEVLNLYETALEARLKKKPLQIVPQLGRDCAADLVARVNAAATRKFGKSSRSLRGRGEEA
jgi:hypothetical protein